MHQFIALIAPSAPRQKFPGFHSRKKRTVEILKFFCNLRLSGLQQNIFESNILKFKSNCEGPTIQGLIEAITACTAPTISTRALGSSFDTRSLS